ncbi:MAG: hypothetical protein ACJAUG_003175 [Halioglobus sp.]|jgi:hypothetical protein
MALNCEIVSSWKRFLKAMHLEKFASNPQMDGAGLV